MGYHAAILLSRLALILLAITGVAAAQDDTGKCGDPAIAGRIQPGTRSPEIRHKFDPPYPDGAIRNGAANMVKICFAIDTDGTPSHFLITGGSDPVLNTAALNAVKQWQYIPAIQEDGNAVKVWVEVPVRFYGPVRKEFVPGGANAIAANGGSNRAKGTVPPASAQERRDSGVPVDDVGVYYSRAGEWVEIPPEIVNWKTGGVVKSVVTAGIVREDVNARIPKPTSSTKLANPVRILVYAPEGTSITEYQLIKLHCHPNSREFRTVTGGIFHVSGGAERDTVAYESTQAAKRTWIIELDHLSGEYGILPPGLNGARGASSQLGKMYTFSIP